MEANRQTQLKDWLDGSYPHQPYTLTPASIDASFRKYYRITSKHPTTHLAVDSPPAHEKNHEWLHVQELLLQQQCNVPLVHSYNLAQGFFIISDLGTTSYLSAYRQDTYPTLVHGALEQILACQQHITSTNLPPYDAALMDQEMELFSQWYLAKHKQITLDHSQQQAWQTTKELLIKSNQEMPQCFVHRDYHSRNLIHNPDNPHKPGIVDFQDAVIGPICYDIVSLLRDCYYACPEQLEQELLDHVFTIWKDSHQLTHSRTTLLRMYELCGIQRQLKATGIFARLHHRDNKSHYLKDIPRTLDYIRNTIPRYPELAPLAPLIAL